MKENTTPDFEAIGEQILKDLPRELAVKARNFFRQSFVKKGFTDRAFMPWPKRKDELGHPMMRLSAQLRNSVKINSITDKEIVIEAGAGLPYAQIHNTGGYISVPVTAKSRKLFWYMYYKTGKEMWKYMALTKKERMSIYIPQRQYIGDSQQLMKDLRTFFGEKVIHAFRNEK